jgi:hypothetical protein
LVLAEIEGVVKLEPVPTGIPPVLVVYQLISLLNPAVALKLTVPVPHLLPGVVLVITGTTRAIVSPAAIVEELHEIKAVT